MKIKSLIILTIGATILAGCSSPQEVEPDSASQTVSTTESSKDELSEKQDKQPAIDEEVKLGIDIETALSNATSTDDVDVENFGEFMNFDHETFSIKTIYNEVNDMRLTEYTLQGEKMPSIIMISAEKYDHDKFVEFGREIFLQSPVWGEDYAKVYEGKGNNTYIFSYVFNHELVAAALPLNFNQMKTSDFLKSSDTRQEIGELLRDHKYDEVLKLAEDYLLTETPHESDSVYQILDYFEPIKEYFDDITIVTDDFDGKQTVVYKDLKSITPTNNFFASIKNNSLYYDYGFEKEHWLFFDKITLKIGDVLYSDSTSKTERDTLGGALIRETASVSKYLTTSLDDILEKAKEESSGTIRFSGSKGDLDLELSKDEIKSLYVITNLEKASESIKDIVYKFGTDVKED